MTFWGLVSSSELQKTPSNKSLIFWKIDALDATEKLAFRTLVGHWFWRRELFSGHVFSTKQLDFSDLKAEMNSLYRGGLRKYMASRGERLELFIWPRSKL